MRKQLGSMPFSEEYLAEDTVGHWVLEEDPGKEPRMYVDDIMLGLIGLEEQTNPEDTFRAWIAGIDEDYMDSVNETARLNREGIRAEVQYPWHYPDGRTILIRCEGIRNFAYKDGLRTEGRHRNVTDLTHLQKEAAVISALAGDFECVRYVILNSDKSNDMTINFRTSERIKQFIPDWERETNFHNILELLIQYFGNEDEDIRDFRAQTRREVVLKHLENEPAFFVNTRANIQGKVQYFQLKFIADRDKEGNLIGIVVGIHSLDDEMRQELLVREKAFELVEEKTRELKQKNETLSKVYNRIIEMVGNIVESRDEESGSHINRVKYLTQILALQIMKDLPEYGMTIEDVNNLAELSPLHDIGKIKIPDSILLKRGKLTDEEFEIMKTHCDKGCEILEGMADGWPPHLSKMSMDICRYHHEKWDGRGYPCGLKGDEIPISAQIVSITDIYDALVSERCYKRAFSHDEAYRMIMDGECGAFSEKLLSCFSKCREAFRMNSVYQENLSIDEGNEELRAVTGSEYISEAVPLLEEISESMPGGFFIYQADSEEKLIYFNNSMVDLLGCSSREEFIRYTGNTFRGIVHPDDYAETEYDIYSQIKDDAFDHVVYRTIRKDGTIRWLDDYGKIIHSEDMGDVFFVFINDFTETYTRRENAFAEINSKTEKSEDSAKGALKNLKVLVVDDSDIARDIHCELLQDEGATVTEAVNGLEAVNLIKESMDYDLILMDLVMPVMNGVVAIREIRQLLDDAEKHITIICLTAEGSDMQIKEALEAGAYECMYKPLNISELSALVIASMKENSLKITQQLAETRKIANTDTLTQVNNIVAFADATTDLAVRVKEDETYQFGVIMCDCDHLKSVNDSYGHDVGDRYIRNTSAAICDVFKNGSIFRIGGDEFVIIIDGADYENADRLFAQLKSKKMKCTSLADIEAGNTSFTVGIALFDRTIDETVGDVIKRADIDMYKNK